ncbi:mucin-2-like [Danaus plexippus]|uniref:mucin-2-like n=1 Tax=Danaus plexippus TaxID=13037 RepID=UPI002AB1BD35|nr:mucin-2-like [Danaus plexippus]
MKCSLLLFSTISACFLDWFSIRWKYILYATMITFIFHSKIENHYIEPPSYCIMAKICNHTGISICGLEKDSQDHRLFLDDCDMFEYNCDNGKVYLKVDDKLCPQNVTKDTIATMTSEQTSETTKNTSVTLPSTITTVRSTASNVTKVPIASECTRSKKTDSSTTVTDSPTTGTNTKNIKTASPEIHRCTCMDAHDKTTEMSTTKILTYSETTESTLPMTKTIQTQSINTSNSTGKWCTCNIPTTESMLTTSTVTTTIETTSAKIERCTCMDRDITTIKTNPSTVTTTYSESIDSTLPITKTTLTQPINTSTATGKRCTCNFSSTSTTDTISTTPITSPTITTTIKPKNIFEKICTCMDTTTALFTTTTELTTSPVTTTSTESSTTVVSSSKPGCTCTPHFISSTETTTSSPIDSDESTETTVDYIEVIPTPDGDSCKKYPAHCKRPRTWETTVRGETRDFFQILREKFGDRIKILKDTTHWPRRTVKAVENYNDGFHFGNHNDLS